MSSESPAIATRPALSAPDALSPAALADARAGQPRRGLIGLAFVLPVAVLLAAGTGGPAASLEAIGTPVTFALPVVAMIAFWWHDWPGTLLRGPWAGLYDTAIVAAGGLVLAAVGRGVVPLAVGIFGLMLQLTLVGEGWPLRGLGRITSGVAALVVCWVVGLAAYLLVVGSGLVDGANYASWFAALGVAQMIGYVVLRGWPFARIRRRAVRLPVAYAAVVAVGWGAYLLASGLGWQPGRIGAVAGAAIAAVLVVSMLFEAWPAIHLTPLPGRVVALALVVALTAALAWTLPLVASATGVPNRMVDGWATHATLNALSLAVILHVAVWRRWPAR